MTVERSVPEVLGVAEVAQLLGIRRPNVRKLLAAYDVEPLADLAVGPVFSRSAIEAVKEQRDADVAAGRDRIGRRRAKR